MQDHLSFDESNIFDNSKPSTFVERILAIKQLIFSKTRLEFRIVWNKLFRGEDEELGWLLDPYHKQPRDVNMMTSIRVNKEPIYRYNYHDILGGSINQRIASMNRETGSILNRSELRKKKEKKSLSENVLQVARYMGLGASITSSALPSPFLPRSDFVNDADIYKIKTIW